MAGWRPLAPTSSSDGRWKLAHGVADKTRTTRGFGSESCHEAILETCVTGDRWRRAWRRPCACRSGRTAGVPGRSHLQRAMRECGTCGVDASSGCDLFAAEALRYRGSGIAGPRFHFSISPSAQSRSLKAQCNRVACKVIWGGRIVHAEANTAAAATRLLRALHSRTSDQMTCSLDPVVSTPSARAASLPSGDAASLLMPYFRLLTRPRSTETAGLRVCELM